MKEQSRKKDLTRQDESKKHYTFDKSKVEGLGALKPTDKVADPQRYELHAQADQRMKQEALKDHHTSEGRTEHPPEPHITFPVSSSSHHAEQHSDGVVADKNPNPKKPVLHGSKPEHHDESPFARDAHLQEHASAHQAVHEDGHRDRFDHTFDMLHHPQLDLDKHQEEEGGWMDLGKHASTQHDILVHHHGKV